MRTRECEALSVSSIYEVFTPKVNNKYLQVILIQRSLSQTFTTCYCNERSVNTADCDVVVVCCANMRMCANT